MTTSVPQVSHITLDRFRNDIGRYLELAVEYRKLSGVGKPYDDAVAMARWLYETHLKEAANLGKMDRKLCDDTGKAIDRLEARK
jgi:hypothetical protein